MGSEEVRDPAGRALVGEEAKGMVAQRWNGIGDYDHLLTLDEEEMRELCRYYDIDWSFFMKSPAKSMDGQYYCFVSLSRKAFALLPFLSLAFGGMYNTLPMENALTRAVIDYGGRIRRGAGPAGEDGIYIPAAEVSMEDFRCPRGNDVQ